MVETYRTRHHSAGFGWPLSKVEPDAEPSSPTQTQICPRRKILKKLRERHVRAPYLKQFFSCRRNNIIRIPAGDGVQAAEGGLDREKYVSVPPPAHRYHHLYCTWCFSASRLMNILRSQRLISIRFGRISIRKSRQIDVHSMRNAAKKWRRFSEVPNSSGRYRMVMGELRREHLRRSA